MIIKYRDEINIQKFSIQIPDLTKKRFNETNRFLSNFWKIEEISKFFPKHFSLRICMTLNFKKKKIYIQSLDPRRAKNLLQLSFTPERFHAGYISG